MTAAQWDARYRAEPDLWTTEPNAPLVEFARELHPGRVLDVGAGDGRNSIWLATQGWSVSSIDLSAVALQRAAERASARGTQLECIAADWHEHDFGTAAFELVVVSFMHPAPEDREALFERVARALVPGGHVFTVGVVLADHGRRGPPDARASVHAAARPRRAARLRAAALRGAHLPAAAPLRTARGHRRRGGRPPAVKAGKPSSAPVERLLPSPQLADPRSAGFARSPMTRRRRRPDRAMSRGTRIRTLTDDTPTTASRPSDVPRNPAAVGADRVRRRLVDCDDGCVYG